MSSDGGEGGGVGDCDRKESKRGQLKEKREIEKPRPPEVKEKEPPLVQFSAGVTHFLSGFTFPRNKKKISMTNSLGKRNRKGVGGVSWCRSSSSERSDRGSYGVLVTGTTVDPGRRGSANINKSMNNNHNASSCNNVVSCGKSRDRRMSTDAGDGYSTVTMARTLDDGGSSDHLHQQQQQNRKLVRIIDHQLDW